MRSTIGKIYDTIPQFYKCKDGTMSTHNGRGACVYHGGLSSAKAIKLRRRCKTIAVQTPAQQIDLFRKETQGDLFTAPVIVPNKTLNTEGAFKAGDLFFDRLIKRFVLTTQNKTPKSYIKWFQLGFNDFGQLKDIDVFKEKRDRYLEPHRIESYIKSKRWEYLGNFPDANIRDEELKRVCKSKNLDCFGMDNQAQTSKDTEGVKPTQKPAIPTASATPTQTNFVLDVPLSQINTAEKLFQNRQHAYSIRSVENIVQAVLDGTFRWANFDPIILWQSPDGKLYVLSGHSRFEAFKRLAAMNKTADGRTFAAIPAKVERNISVEEAKEIALNSNTLSHSLFNKKR